MLLKTSCHHVCQLEIICQTLAFCSSKEDKATYIFPLEGQKGSGWGEAYSI